MEFILLTISKLVEGVNIKKLFIIMLDKLQIYVDGIMTNDDKSNEEENNKLITDIYNVYPILMRNFDIVLNNELKSMNKVILDILEFNIAFIKYTNKCAPENEKLNSINHILNFSVQILSTFNIQSFFKAEIDKVCELLSVPLESIYSLFDMPNFPQLLLFLDYTNMKKIGLKIINNLINPNSKEVIDSLDKIHKLFGFIQPLLRNIQSVEEENDPNFEVEQNTVAKLLFVIRSQDPEVLLEIYNELKNVLFEGKKKRRVIIFPALANILINFCQKLSTLYENKDNEEKKENSFDISKLESDDDFYEFMSKIYQLLTDTIKVIEEDFPLMALKLNLLTSCQIDTIKSDREKFQEICISFLDNSLNIYNNLDKEKKFEIFTDICQKLLQITIISQENLEKYFTQFLAEVKGMPTRTDQCVGYLIMSQMYFTHFKDGKKVLDCLSKAKKIADFSLTNPRNLILYIYLLNKYIYYIDIDTENIVEIDNEYIEDLIEAIKNHMVTIKTDKNIDACFLPEIEKYFKNTLNLITQRKSEEEHKEIYDKINVDSE
jgi:vacuolar protein sorting-associated protein 35